MHYIHCFTHCLRITAKGAYGHVSLTSFSLCCRVLTCLLCPSATPRSNPKGGWNADSSKPPTAQHGRTLQTLLRQASIATRNHEYARARALNDQIQNTASKLNIPLCKPFYITVPYLQPCQRQPLNKVIDHVVNSLQRPPHERCAIRANIKLVRSVPLTVRRAFERHANKQCKSSTRPPCHCDMQHLPTWSMGGTVYTMDNHFCLLPVTS